MYTPAVKLRLERNGRFVLSEGRARLLTLVEETGSISAAARKMGMSYRHAWGVVKGIGESIGAEAVASKRGGSSGGRTLLTAEGKAALAEYSRWQTELSRLARFGPGPSLTVDGVLLQRGRLLLIKRGREPFMGRWALPGGFVEHGETVEKAVAREFREETGMAAKPVALVGVYSDPGRDPRGHTVAVAFLLGEPSGKAKGGDDASEARWHRLDRLPELAFDHADIIADAVALAGRMRLPQMLK